MSRGKQTSLKMSRGEMRTCSSVSHRQKVYRRKSCDGHWPWWTPCVGQRDCSTLCSSEYWFTIRSVSGCTATISEQGEKKAENGDRVKYFGVDSIRNLEIKYLALIKCDSISPSFWHFTANMWPDPSQREWTDSTTVNDVLRMNYRLSMFHLNSEDGAEQTHQIMILPSDLTAWHYILKDGHHLFNILNTIFI